MKAWMPERQPTLSGVGPSRSPTSVASRPIQTKACELAISFAHFVNSVLAFVTVSRLCGTFTGAGSVHCAIRDMEDLERSA